MNSGSSYKFGWAIVTSKLTVKEGRSLKRRLIDIETGTSAKLRHETALVLEAEEETRRLPVQVVE